MFRLTCQYSHFRRFSNNTSLIFIIVKDILFLIKIIFVSHKGKGVARVLKST